MDCYLSQSLAALAAFALALGTSSAIMSVPPTVSSASATFTISELA